MQSQCMTTHSTNPKTQVICLNSTALQICLSNGVQISYQKRKRFRFLYDCNQIMKYAYVISFVKKKMHM